MGIGFPRQLSVLRDFAPHYGEQYWPTVISAFDWQDKFIGIERKIKGDNGTLREGLPPGSFSKEEEDEIRRRNLSGVVEPIDYDAVF